MTPRTTAKILLVDDRPENLLALEATLEPLGQTLIRAHSGVEALRQLLTDEFAVILLDVQMPGLNGFETAEIIKSREKTRYTPIIFLTAISKEQEFIYKGYSVGAVDYMFKPLQPEVLRSKVAVFVDLYLQGRQLREQQIRLREADRDRLELKHRAELSESEARIGQIVHCVTEAIISFDVDLRITLFNTGAERMFGHTASKMIGEVITDLLHEESRREFLTKLDELGGPDCDTVRWDGGSDAELLVGIREDGDEFPLEASLSRLDVAEGFVYTVIAKDVSDRRRSELALRNRTIELGKASGELEALNRELRRRTAELEKALSARSRFYASMSHELRTPINAILGYSSLLLDHVYGPLNERQLNGIERTHRAAKHLLELVNDVLDLSKIEAGKIELQLEPVTLPTLIEDLFVTVRPMADEHGSSLSFHHDGQPVTIISDPRRVRQILLNLLSNAIKFGRRKPIRVESREWGDRGIEIDVIDQGVGIAKGDQDKIFDEFVQLARSDRQDGTGLGLPISQRLAVILNGSLAVKSEPGVGSSFRLRLPRMSDSLAAPPEEETERQPAATKA
jgi:PAS domain S-box-containing protein